MDMWVTAAFRDGKGVEFRRFTDESKALASVGVEDRHSE